MSTPLLRRRAVASAGAVVALSATLLTVLVAPAQATPPGLPGSPPAVPPSDRFAAPPIDWGECDPAGFPTVAETGASIVPASYRCADYSLPLDYDRPDGEQITVALIKRPAAAPASEAQPAPAATPDPQGTIFINPGGPGASGVDTVAGAGEALFGPEVLSRFDVVGFDPRGIARSTALQCYPDAEARDADAAADELRVPWPESREEFTAVGRDARDLARDCLRTAGPILRHMGTTNVARDLDVLRRAVGDPQLNFIGYSYGTYVCAQYIAQYPDRVGAVVCDANIDPVEYATGEPPTQGFRVPNLARARTEVGADATLAEFFRLCDGAGPEACAFAPDSAARFSALYDRLSAQPLDLTEEGGPQVLFDERSLLAQVGPLLYNPLTDFPVLALLLAEFELLAAGGTPEPVEEQEPEILPPAVDYYAGQESFLGVSCSDNVQPRGTAPWRRAILRAEGLFGRYWASGDVLCSFWPAYDFDTVLGPFDRPTANPVLVVNTRFDPATPWEDAVDHERRYPNAAFLSVEGWGHVGQGLSQCGDDLIDTYVLTRTVPADQTTCVQDVAPFAPVPGPEPAPAEETIPEDVLAAAADAALAEIADGDPSAAGSAAAEVVVAGLEQAGQAELAEAVRTREAILRQARTGPFGVG